MIRVSRTAVLFLLLCSMTTTGSTTGAAPPEMVSVVVEVDEAIVTWAPPRDANADTEYRVYVLDGGTTLLGTTSLTTFKATGAHKTYGVSSVINGVESEIRRACLTISMSRIPPLAIDTDCPPRIH